MRKFIQPKKCVGPSQLSSILGFNKWCDRSTLKKKLEEGYWDDSNERTDFGCQNESVVRAFYERYKKVTVQEAPFVRGCNGRLVGKGDGLVGTDGGLEIKCHFTGDVLDTIPPYYMIQIVAYMFLYKRSWWDFMSCSFQDGKLKKCKIIRVYWKNHMRTWENEWYPAIVTFIREVKWKS